MKRAITSYASGPEYLRIAATTWPRMAVYADTHGASWLPCLDVPLHRPASWVKLICIAKALADHDEVLWLDVDVVVREFGESIFDEVPSQYYQAFVVHNFMGGRVPNAGIWLCRRAMLPYLVEAAMQDDLVNHRWWEQAALHRLLGMEDDGNSCHLTKPTHLAFKSKVLSESWNHVGCSPEGIPRKFVHGAGMPNRIDWVLEQIK